jgi:hypothetical protein
VCHAEIVRMDDQKLCIGGITQALGHCFGLGLSQ